MTRSRTPLPSRRLVLDASAAEALRSTARHDQRRAAVVLAIAAADAGVSVPTSVRIEVAWDRRSAAWSNANRLARTDDELDASTADLAAATVSGPAPAGKPSGQPSSQPSVADRHVAVAAHLHAVIDGTVTVEVLTSDVTDVHSVLDALPGAPSPVDVRSL